MHEKMGNHVKFTVLGKKFIELLHIPFKVWKFISNMKKNYGRKGIELNKQKDNHLPLKFVKSAVTFTILIILCYKNKNKTKQRRQIKYTIKFRKKRIPESSDKISW